MHHGLVSAENHGEVFLGRIPRLTYSNPPTFKKSKSRAHSFGVGLCPIAGDRLGAYRNPKGSGTHWNPKQKTKGVAMNTLEIKGDWNIIVGKLKQKWAKLTDADVQFSEGKEEELLGRIQKATGETREAVEKAVKDACSSCCCK